MIDKNLEFVSGKGSKCIQRLSSYTHRLQDIQVEYDRITD